MLEAIEAYAATGSPRLADLLKLMAAGKVVISCPDAADALEMSLEELEYLVVDAIEGGWVEVTDDPKGWQNLSLTPLGASRLGLVLSEDSLTWCPVSLERRNRREWPNQVPSKSFTGLSTVSLELLAEEEIGADPGQSDPLNAVLAEEEISAYDRLSRSNARPDPPQRARHFLALAEAWPLQDMTRPILRRCPKCTGFTLKFAEYCLWCDRSGADHLIKQPKPESRRAYRPGRLKGGV